MGITFNGAYIGLPGAYYADSVAATAPATPPTTPPMIAIMYSWGPKPKTAVNFTNAQNLLNAMRGSPSSAFVSFISDPSPLLNGAQAITLIDPSTNTQSSGALLTSGATAQTLLVSTLYGPPSNQLTQQVLNGSIAGLKLILTDNYSGSEFVGDNLTVPFQLAYSGVIATGTATYTVVVSGTNPTFSVSGVTASDTFSVAIGSGTYATVSQLVDYLNGTGYYFAESLSSTGGQLPSTLLTAGSGTLAAPSGGVLQYTNVRAYLQDIQYWVNQFASTLASGSIVSGATDTASYLPVTGSVPVFFSGARGIPPTTSDYASALNVALTVPGWTVFCDSNSAAVQSLLAAHVEIASTAPYGAWRRGFTGSSIGDTVGTTTTNAIGLDSLQMNYLYPGIYYRNTLTGVNQLYGGLYAAAAAAAMATGNIVALPLTNKPLNATGVENANGGLPLTQSQLTTLRNNGVMAIYIPQQTGVPTILSDTTTWQVDNNVANTSSQQVACRYWLAYSSIAALQPYVGSIASPLTEVNILNAQKKILNGLVYTGGSSNGVLASGAGVAPWSNLQLTYTGSNEVAGVTFDATLVGQNAFITCYASIQPLNFTITDTVAA